MHIDELGSSTERCVVLLHGAPGIPEHFDGLARTLAANGFRVLIPHLPGYRRTPALPGRCDFPEVRGLLEQELQQRGVASAAIVGHSGGAYRAFDLALAGNLRVTHIVALGALAGFDEPLKERYRGFAQLLREKPDACWTSMRDTFVGLMLAPAAVTQPALVEQVLEVARAPGPGVLAAEFNAFARCADLRPRLGEVAAQVTLRVGAEDAVTAPALSHEIAAGLRSAAVQVVPGCGHSLLIEDSAATIAAVVRALASS
jgi:pimeloyl-ACP methyl ester carboxylesterase